MDIAQSLIDASGRKPKQAFLRRAASTIYYAMFHALANCCADMLIGARGESTSKHAWIQTYRALDHGFAKGQCSNRAVVKRFPPEIVDFSVVFVAMQSKRHLADYDPSQRFYKSGLIEDLSTSRSAIDAFAKASAKDKRAFASFVLHRQRGP